MVELPQRFVPTTSRFVSPVRIVIQSGHAYAVEAVGFSPCLGYFASVDRGGWARVWSLDTLDVLGIFMIDFPCRSVRWETLGEIVFCGDSVQRVVGFDIAPAAEAVPDTPASAGYVIRLLTSPEVSSEGTTVRIIYDETCFEHEVAGLVRYEVDPCERYVAALSPRKIVVLNTYADEVLLSLDAPDGRSWVDLKCSWSGDVFTAVLDDGSVWQCNPIKKSFTCIHRDAVRVTACVFGGNRLILTGDDRGSVTVFDIESGAVVLRTPRHPRSFDAVYPSPDKVGFVALRSESATAFLSQSLEILSSAPLPSAHVASCSGDLTSEVIVACRDGAFYRIKLDDNSILKLFDTDKTADCIACRAETVFVHFSDGSSGVYNGRDFSWLDWHSAQVPLAMAVSNNQKTVAALFGDRIEIIPVQQPGEIRSFGVWNASQIVFGKEKTANWLIVIREDLSVGAVDIRTLEWTELGRLDIEHARVLSVAPAAKSYFFVLLAAEHGHLSVLRVSLGSAKSSLVLRVFSARTQIWGVTRNDESVSLRNDANCLRIVQGLRSFSLDDWTRSEPLALF